MAENREEMCDFPFAEMKNWRVIVFIVALLLTVPVGIALAWIIIRTAAVTGGLSPLVIGFIFGWIGARLRGTTKG